MPEAIKVGMILQPQAAHWENYMDILAGLDEVSSVVVADETGGTFHAARQRIGQRLGSLYRDVREMLEEERPGMALISHEGADAPARIGMALDAGCHVLAEKPACVREEDFAALVDKARSAECHLMLAFGLRGRPMVREARRLVGEGKLGSLYGAHAYFIADQTRVRDKEHQQSWYFKKKRGGGGHLIWLGIHFLDLFQHVLGQKIREVSAFTGVVGGEPIEVEDSATVMVRFANGACATLTSGYYLDSSKQSFFGAWGEEGWLRMWPIAGDRLEWASRREEGEPVGGAAPAALGEKSRIFERPSDIYRDFVRSALRASLGLEPAPVLPEEGLHVLRTIFAAYRSAETGMVHSVE